MLPKSLTSSLLTTLLAASAFGQLVFNPQLARQINFPDTPVGQSSELRYTATSQGQGPWTVTLNTNNQAFAAEPRQFVVQNGQQVGFILRFTPQQVGQINGALTGSIQNGNAIQRIQSSLAGAGIEGGDPELSLDSEDILFEIYVDAMGTLWSVTDWPIQFTNIGDALLEINSITPSADWITCDRGAFNLDPGEMMEVTFSVPQNEWEAMEPDFYEAEVTIACNDPNQRELVLPVLFDRGLIPHYLVVLGDQEPASSHIILVEDATLDGEALGQWDEVGVFTPRGDLAGSGAFDTELPIAFQVWIENQQNGFAGMRAGEPFDFRIWDHSAEEEFQASAEFLEGPSRFEADGMSMVALSTLPDAIELSIPLRRGWSLMSIRVTPDRQFWIREEGPDIVRLFAGVRDHIDLVKNQTGQFYSPRNNFCNIPYHPLSQGMMVRTSDADTLTILGVPIPSDTPIALNIGWNMTAYYPSVRMTVRQAFEDLNRQGVVRIIKDGFGRFCIPAFEYGFDLVIEPNSGLQVNVSQACQFHYPAEAARDVHPAESAENTVWYPNPEPTGANMSVLFRSIGGINVRDGAELACFDPRGRIAGSVRISGDPPYGMAVWADDVYTEDIVEGFHEGEPLVFRYWDPGHDWDYAVDINVIQGEAVFAVNEFLVLGAEVGVKPDERLLPDDVQLHIPYPNPFNSTTRIDFDLPRAATLKLTLTDQSGREVMNLAGGAFSAGQHSIQLNAERLPGGVYLAVLQVGEKRMYQKVVLLK
jgi:hypothetical protein